MRYWEPGLLLFTLPGLRSQPGASQTSNEGQEGINGFWRQLQIPNEPSRKQEILYLDFRARAPPEERLGLLDRARMVCTLVVNRGVPWTLRKI